MQKNINPSITQQEAVEMLSQHIITKPVFEALFDGYSFVKNNPISVSMQTMLDLLEDQAFDKDAETLKNFYESVKMRASGIDNAEGKQRIIIELYDKFFKTAFPKMVEKLGIVYTPVEVVDFIIHSVNDVLKKEFNRNLGDENVHILDPFTGTGTFITRLLQSGLITKKQLPHKYEHELHANEIVLLAYYIAAVNIENAFHDAMAATDYHAFEGICLTDTFQLGEKEIGDLGDVDEQLKDMFKKDMFPQNTARVTKQKNAPLRVIIGNPPYSIGQKSEMDNAQNQNYPHLEGRISKTYVAESNTTMNKALYDAYIKAFRWSTDRLDENGGIVAFVSNGAWLEGNATTGFRKSLEKEFSAIHVFNLRGNQRTSGELSRKEGGKIFGSGSRTPIAITFLVKNPKSKNEKAKIHYHDIGDYLNREEKLDIIKKFASLANGEMKWQTLESNEHGDWLNHRNSAFELFFPFISEDTKESSIFDLNSNGVVTNRDSWVYNFSKKEVGENVKRMLDFYTEQVNGFKVAQEKNPKIEVEEFIDTNSAKISWTRSLKNSLKAKHSRQFDSNNIYVGFYRPFQKQYLYFNRNLNECVYQQPKLFPTPDAENLVITTTGIGVNKEFTTLITNCIPDLQVQANGQCFPLYYYEEQKLNTPGLFDAAGKNQYVRRDGVSDFILERAQKIYGSRVAKEDIFYYVYGILHSPHYRTAFANDLKKMLPRLPLVDEPKQFWQLSKAGRALAELHINYEQYEKPKGITLICSPDYAVDYASILNEAPASYEAAGSKRSKKQNEDAREFFRVEKMRFPSKADKSSIIYNSKITIDGIPSEAFNYVVNGKSAIEWIMERYQVTVHKESGIRNDPNDWAPENPKYILDLLLSVIHVSLETVKIVEGLPEVKWG